MKGKGGCSNIFNIVRAVQIPKKGGLEAHSVRDPISRELVVSNNEIKNVFLKYCANVLKPNEVE